MGTTVSGGPDYRVRSAAEAAWAGSAAYGRREGVLFRIGSGVRAVARLIMPVLLLLASFAAIYLYLDTPATEVAGSADGRWLTVGHLLVPLSFLCVNLTNRRYGPAYAFSQVVLALAVSVAFVMLVAPDLAPYVPARTVPDLRVAGAFGAAFFVASFISIVVFDGARGPRWWMAPLLAMLASVVIFDLVFYPAAYAGLADWTHRMTVHLEFLAGLAVLSLVPYWFLRGLVRPLPGFNGY
jgi:uncharacterized PurR-regulated membrane protein YhhQ (DUF165 family)